MLCGAIAWSAYMIADSLPNWPVNPEESAKLAADLLDFDVSIAGYCAATGADEPADIEERKLGNSAMPEDLPKKLSRSELRDLVEFLAGLK